MPFARSSARGALGKAGESLYFGDFNKKSVNGRVSLSGRSNRSNQSALRLLACAALVLAWAALPARAQTTGQLTISLAVQSSISLVFQNNPAVGSTGYCPLTNAGTNNVGLDLGSASFAANSDSLPCVAYSRVGGAQYQVSSAFDVVVTKANSSSPNYRLAAQISTAPPANVSWLVSGTPLNSATPTQLDASDAYGSRITKSLQVQVKNNVPGQILSETVTFTATAN